MTKEEQELIQVLKDEVAKKFNIRYNYSENRKLNYRDFDKLKADLQKVTGESPGKDMLIGHFLKKNYKHSLRGYYRDLLARYIGKKHWEEFVISKEQSQQNWNNLKRSEEQIQQVIDNLTRKKEKAQQSLEDVVESKEKEQQELDNLIRKKEDVHQSLKKAQQSLVSVIESKKKKQQELDNLSIKKQFKKNKRLFFIIFIGLLSLGTLFYIFIHEPNSSNSLILSMEGEEYKIGLKDDTSQKILSKGLPKSLEIRLSSLEKNWVYSSEKTSEKVDKDSIGFQESLSSGIKSVSNTINDYSDNSSTTIINPQAAPSPPNPVKDEIIIKVEKKNPVSTNYLSKTKEIHIKGKVIYKNTREAIAGANIFVEGLKDTIESDKNGVFEFSIREKLGNYIIIRWEKGEKKAKQHYKLLNLSNKKQLELEL